MKGHLRERSPGKWAIVLDVGERDPRTGKKKRKWHSFTGTKREAQREAARLITELETGRYVEPRKETVAEFFARWLEFSQPHLSAKSWERYSDLLTKNLVPQIGATTLNKLDVATFDAALSKLQVSGRLDGKGGLSPLTIRHIRSVARKAFNQAIAWGLIQRNPAALSKAPKVERKEMHAYDAAQAAKLLEALRGTRLFAPAVILLMTGMRRGEALALRWRHIDFERRTISVEQSIEQVKGGIRFKPPKNGKGRVVSMSATLIEEMKAHRAKQAEEQLRLGVRPDADSFVIAQYDGQPLQPRSLSHEWNRIVKGIASLPYIRLHDLRHSHATMMLSANVHPKIVQERLGHSSVGITLDLYSHATQTMQDEAAERVDAALQAAISGEAKAK